MKFDKSIKHLRKVVLDLQADTLKARIQGDEHSAIAYTYARCALEGVISRLELQTTTAHGKIV